MSDQINVPPPLRAQVFDREDTAEVALQEGVGDELHEVSVKAHKTKSVLFSVVDRLRGAEVFSFNPVGGATPAQGLCNGLRRLGAEYSGVADEIEDSSTIVRDKRGVWSIMGDDGKRKGGIRLDEQSQCVNITVGGGGFKRSFGAEYTEGDHTLHLYSGSVLHANALQGLCNAAPEARTLEESKRRYAQQIERVKGHLNTTLKEMGDDPARPKAAGFNLGFKVMGGLNRLEKNALIEAGLSRGVRHGLAIKKTQELDITGCGEFLAAASLALKEELSGSTPTTGGSPPTGGGTVPRPATGSTATGPIRSPPPPRKHPGPHKRTPTARRPSPISPPTTPSAGVERTAALATRFIDIHVNDQIDFSYDSKSGKRRRRTFNVMFSGFSGDSALNQHNLVLGCGRTKTAWQAHPNRTLGDFEKANPSIRIHKVIPQDIEKLLASTPAPRPPAQPIAPPDTTGGTPRKPLAPKRKVRSPAPPRPPLVGLPPRPPRYAPERSKTPDERLERRKREIVAAVDDTRKISPFVKGWNPFTRGKVAEQFGKLMKSPIERSPINDPVTFVSGMVARDVNVGGFGHEETALEMLLTQLNNFGVLGRIQRECRASGLSGEKLDGAIFGDFSNIVHRVTPLEGDLSRLLWTLRDIQVSFTDPSGRTRTLQSSDMPFDLGERTQFLQGISDAGGTNWDARIIH